MEMRHHGPLSDEPPPKMTASRGCFSFSSVSPTSIEMLSKVTVTVVPFSEQAPLLPNIKPAVLALPESSAVVVPPIQVLYSTVVRSIPEKSCKVRLKPSCVCQFTRNNRLKSTRSRMHSRNRKSR